MKAKLFMILQTVFLGLGVLVFIPTANPTAVGMPGSPNPSNVASNIENGSYESQAKTTPGQPKPLAVWECTTSWYGDDFDGQETANGETYDMYPNTAGHPPLPL